MSLEDLKFLANVYCGMLQPKKPLNFLIWFYHDEPKKVMILNELIDVTKKDEKVHGWTFMINEQLIMLVSANFLLHQWDKSSNCVQSFKMFLCGVNSS